MLLMLVFVAGFAGAELAVVHVPSGRTAYTVTLSEIPVVAALFFLTPMQYVIVRVVGAALPLAWRNRRSPLKLVFNLAMYWFEAVVAVSVWHLVARCRIQRWVR